MQGGDFFKEVLSRARAPINDFQISLHGSPQDSYGLHGTPIDTPQFRGSNALDFGPQVHGTYDYGDFGGFRMPKIDLGQALHRALNPSQYDPATGKPISTGQKVGNAAQGSSTTPGYMPQGGSQTEFLSSAMALAARALADAGMPVELAPIMAGIAANETGYGNPKYVHGNNYFGIKGGSGPLLNTWEVRNGKTVNEQAAFREYGNPLESFRGFIGFLRDNPRYAAALTQTDNPEGFIKAIHNAGYATDPAWSTKVINIANTAKLVTPNQGAVDAGFQLNQGTWPAQPMSGTSQMELGLPRDIALAFCAPAGVMEFMKAMGRTPNVTETLNLAKQFGWNQSVGAAGPQSVANMLNSIGIMAVNTGVDENRVRADVQAGKPVLIDTPGHYYQVIGANPDGTFNFGDAVGRRHGPSRLSAITSMGFGAPRSAIHLAGQ